MKRLFITLAEVLLLASACTYPYETVLDTESEGIVIEGEILIGDVAEFAMSRKFPLSSDYDEIEQNIYVPADFTVEDSQGRLYEDKEETVTYGYGVHYSLVDLTTADPTLSYRLHAVNRMTGKEYVSDWTEVERSVVIDNMSYVPDSTATKMNFRMSFHAPAHSTNFMVKLRENWEYRSMYNAEIYYTPFNEGVRKFQDGENIYYCWNEKYLGKFVMLSTEELSEDVIVNYFLTSVPKTSRKLSYIYSLEATVIPLSKEAYLYWDYLKTLSEYSGSLFAPNPSDMRGNLHSVDDPDEIVTGYVSATEVSKSRVFFNNDIEAFYIQPHVTEDEYMIPVTPDNFSYYYNRKKYLPVSGTPMQGYYWAPARCVDCRMEGGTKNKPAWWPNDDK